MKVRVRRFPLESQVVNLPYVLGEMEIPSFGDIENVTKRTTMLEQAAGLTGAVIADYFLVDGNWQRTERVHIPQGKTELIGFKGFLPELVSVE